jgi:hypothetical protein
MWGASTSGVDIVSGEAVFKPWIVMKQQTFQYGIHFMES